VDEYLATAPEARIASQPKESKVDPRAARKELARVERQLEKLALREERLHAQMAEHSTDFVKVAELDGALKDLTSEKAALEEEWLILADSLS
jgi:ABC transport system ATP-binding/permease protein